MTYYNCRQCRTRIQTGTPLYGIGLPYKTCPTCQTVNVFGEKITEWELKPKQTRFWLHAANIIFAVLFGGCGAGMLSDELIEGRFIRPDAITWESAFWLGTIILYSLLSLWLGLNIRKSRKRMRNPEHVAYLRKLGILLPPDRQGY